MDSSFWEKTAFEGNDRGLFLTIKTTKKNYVHVFLITHQLH